MRLKGLLLTVVLFFFISFHILYSKEITYKIKIDLDSGKMEETIKYNPMILSNKVVNFGGSLKNIELYIGNNKLTLDSGYVVSLNEKFLGQYTKNGLVNCLVIKGERNIDPFVININPLTLQIPLPTVTEGSVGGLVKNVENGNCNEIKSTIPSYDQVVITSKYINHCFTKRVNNYLIVTCKPTREWLMNTQISSFDIWITKLLQLLDKI